jgi:hypothetical protein
MTHRGLPRNCLLLLIAMCMGSGAKAGVWVTEPVVGLAADYSTNPGLRYAAHTAETHGAVLIDTPTTYHAGAVSLSVQPSFRISNSSGYSSLASDYAHLTAKGEIDAERNSVTVTGQIARDSSLYYNYGLNGSAGVRRDTSLADVAWVRALTERLNFNLEANSSRVLYGKSVSFTTLTDYRYTSAAPSLAWNTSERTTLTLLGGAGLYTSADLRTKSVNSNLELGFTRQLTQLWALSANAGYSRETNTIEEYFGPYLLGTFRATNTGTVFMANVTRQGRLLAVTAAASRSLVPSGFSFLSLQNSYQLSFRYPRTERWTFDGHVRWLKSQEPQVFGPTVDQSYLDLGLSAAWLFTEKWTLTLRASRVTAKYTPPTVDVGASGFTVQLSRRFDPIKWH